MSDAGRFDNRYLPADLFRASITGNLPLHEAQRIARERWEADERRGGSMDDLIRAALAGNSRGDKVRRFEAARDERGRFAKDEPADLTMNERIRASLGQTAEGGTINVSHLMARSDDDES